MPTVELPPWVLMWGTALLIFGCLKILSWTARSVEATPQRHLAYLIGWPGMDADAFLGRSTATLPIPAEWLFAVLNTLAGAVLIWGVIPRVTEQSPGVAGAIGMSGIILSLHFGLFHLLSCVWRSCGIAAVPIMNRPFNSQSVSEFWGQRWNLAFRDLTHRFLFRPLTRRIGPRAALMVGFGISGLIHDLVISVPAHGGGGLPTIYFVLQGVAILVERSSYGRNAGLGTGRIGRLYCAAILILPSPLLFHPPFLTQVIYPFLLALGARP